MDLRHEALANAINSTPTLGRPTDYSDEVVALLCAELATGASLRTVCDMEGMPDKATVFRWLAKHEAFRDQYARAKEEAADALTEEMLDISDDGRNDWMERLSQEGECIGYQVNGEAIQRSRLRVDTRKWLAMKLKPKKYGERQEIEHSGSLQVTRVERQIIDPKD